MSQKDIQKLISIVQRLVGTPCWGVAAGGCTGSRFILDFGERLERAVEINNPVLPAIRRKFRGELLLHVGCAAWRLDSTSEVITSSTDLSTPDGPMVSGLEGLRGREVTSAMITQPGLDLVLEFDKVRWLRVFCDQVEGDLDNYTVAYRATFVAVGPRSSVSLETGEDLWPGSQGNQAGSSPPTMPPAT